MNLPKNVSPSRVLVIIFILPRKDSVSPRPRLRGYFMSAKAPINPSRLKMNRTVAVKTAYFRTIQQTRMKRMKSFLNSGG